MTNREIYRQYLGQLQTIYNESEAAVITDWVFEKVAGLQRADIIKNPLQNLDVTISEDLAICLDGLLQHKPVQYVLGEAWFYKMKLVVNKYVLIPRPETEELVKLVVDDYLAIQDKNKSAISDEADSTKLQKIIAGRSLSVLDIGTGSGCIAIAVKKSLPVVAITAIDVSMDALSVAKENAISQSVEIEFLLVDFLDEGNWEKLPVFDIIISNPPYIPENEKARLDKNVTAFEPPAALFVPENAPLLFYKKIAAFGKRHLRKNGKIYLEVHEDLAKETAEVFENSYTSTIKKDLFGKDRMLIAEFDGLQKTDLFIPGNGGRSRCA